jgi:hypothetical protein
MRLHVEALFTHDARGDLLLVNDVGGGPAPRFFLGRTVDGSVQRYRSDVSRELRRTVEAASAIAARGTEDFDAPLNALPYEAILARDAAVARTWIGPAFCFPPDLPSHDETILVTEANVHVLHPHLVDWIPDVQLHPPMFARIVNGHAAAVCCSVRITEEADEAGVETASPYRGRGYAAQVVAAWARAVREMGRVPLYSTSWQNEASRAVARKLGLIQFGSDLHIT